MEPLFCVACIDQDFALKKLCTKCFFNRSKYLIAITVTHTKIFFFLLSLCKRRYRFLVHEATLLRFVIPSRVQHVQVLLHSIQYCWYWAKCNAISYCVLFSRYHNYEYVKLVAAMSMIDRTKRILKRIFTDELASQFSWLGTKAKKTLPELVLANVIKVNFISSN